LDINELGDKLNEKIEKESKKKSSSKEDPEEIKEILGIVSNEVPQLITNIFKAIYDPSIAENYGKGIGALYRELKEQGLPDDIIDGIVKNFAKSFDIVGQAMQSIPKQIEVRKKKEEEEEEEEEEED
jgi:hypothetical protein